MQKGAARRLFDWRTQVKDRWQVGKLGLQAAFAIVCVADCIFHRWPECLLSHMLNYNVT